MGSSLSWSTQGPPVTRRSDQIQKIQNLKIDLKETSFNITSSMCSTSFGSLQRRKSGLVRCSQGCNVLLEFDFGLLFCIVIGLQLHQFLLIFLHLHVHLSIQQMFLLKKRYTVYSGYMFNHFLISLGTEPMTLALIKPNALQFELQEGKQKHLETKKTN